MEPDLDQDPAPDTDTESDIDFDLDVTWAKHNVRMDQTWVQDWILTNTKHDHDQSEDVRVQI